MSKYLAELIGTFAIVFCGIGAIIINQQSNGLVSYAGIAITFGLIVMAMIYSLGNISGAHFNPAVTIAFTIAKRFQLKQDWETGKTGEQVEEVGAIRVDTRTALIYPMEINLEKGSWWTGFKSMAGLGMQHIKEGTDHLLFLLVLLLPATLLVNGKRWGSFGGTRYSVIRLFKTSTAFTAGHSLTLLLGALKLVQLSPQPVEILIAVSILISAIHAIRPIFPGREIYVAAGFGLVHGLHLYCQTSN